MTINIELIEQAFDNNLDGVDVAAVEENVSEVFNSLNSGNIRVAYKSGKEWIVNQWIKKAILLSFKLKNNKLTDVGYTKYYDKLVSRFENISENYLKENNIRIVPQAIAREGTFIGNNAVSYTHLTLPTKA